MATDTEKSDKYVKATIRAVRILEGEPKELAEQQHLKPTDIVIVKKSMYHSLPSYKVEKITGSIVEYLKKNGLKVND